MQYTERIAEITEISTQKRNKVKLWEIDKNPDFTLFLIRTGFEKKLPDMSPLFRQTISIKDYLSGKFKDKDNLLAITLYLVLNEYDHYVDLNGNVIRVIH